MSEIIKLASAGTMESSDAYVEISPCDTVQVEIESVVKGQFGDVIEAVKRSPVRILLVHGESDHFVPLDMSRRIAASAPDTVTLHTYPNASHALSYIADRERYEKMATDYLSKDQHL